MVSISLPKIAHSDFAVPGRKPVGPVEIDWSNPLTKGLVFYAAPGVSGGVDMVTGRPPESDTTQLNAGADKSRAAISGTINYGDVSGRVIGDWDEITMLCRYPVGTDVNESLLFQHERLGAKLFKVDASFDSWIALHLLGTNQTLYNATEYSSGTLVAAADTASDNIRVYVDGKGIVDTAHTVSTYTVNSTDDIRVDVTNAGAFFGVGAVWRRRLSDADMRVLSLDPYQILKPAIPLQFYVAGATVSSFDKVFNLSLLSNLRPELLFNTANSVKINADDVINITSGLKVNSNNILLNIYNLAVIQTDIIVILDNILSVLANSDILISSLSNLHLDNQVFIEALLEAFGNKEILVEVLALVDNISNLNVSWQGEQLLTADAIILLDYLSNINLDKDLFAESILDLEKNLELNSENLESSTLDKEIYATSLESANIDEDINFSNLRSLEINREENISYSSIENSDKEVNYSYISNLNTDLVNSIESLQNIFGVYQTPVSNKESVFNGYVFNIANKITSYIDKQLNTEWAGEAYLDIDALYPVDWIADTFIDNTVNTENVLLVYADSAYIAEINQGLEKQSSIPLANIADIYYNNEINAEFVSKLFIDKNLPISNTIIVFNNKDFRISQETLISFTAESDIEALTNILASSDVSIESLILSSIDPFSFPVSNNTIAEQIAQLNIDWSGVSAIFKHNVHSVYFLDPRGYVYTVKFNKDTWKVQDSKSNVWGVS